MINLDSHTEILFLACNAVSETRTTAVSDQYVVHLSKCGNALCLVLDAPEQVLGSFRRRAVEKAFVLEEHRRRLHITVVDYLSNVPVKHHDFNQVSLVRTEKRERGD